MLTSLSKTKIFLSVICVHRCYLRIHGSNHIMSLLNDGTTCTHARMSTITFGYQIVIAMLFPCSNHEISIVYRYLDIVGLLELLPLLLVHLKAKDKFYL